MPGLIATSKIMPFLFFFFFGYGKDEVKARYTPEVIAHEGSSCLIGMNLPAQVLV